MTLREVLAAASAQLSGDEHLRVTAKRDAELLLLHALRISRVTLLAQPGREIDPAQQSLFQTLIERRLQREPIQYIIGQQEFYGLAFNVSPAVLIPRPETEHLVEAVLHLLPSEKPLKIADVGTGSGAIAVTLAFHLPQASITALDISRNALAIAEANAVKHDVTARIRFLRSDLLAAVLSEPSGTEKEEYKHTFDAVVSNPPYVAESDRDALHPQVRDHEPATALFAGETGLDIYRRLIPQAWNALKPNGLLALEIGHGQRDALANLLSAWAGIAFVNDLQAIPRVALARKPADVGVKGLKSIHIHSRRSTR